MTFSVEQGDPAVIAIDGDVLGGAGAMEFTNAVADLIRGGTSNVIVDLGGVHLMNSSGFGMLVGASTTVRSAGGTLAVAGANEKIQSLLKMTRLDSVFASYPTRDEALAAYQQG
jgi:anti-sigma B factor antagonist